MVNEKQLLEIYTEFAKIISTKFNIELEEILKYIPKYSDIIETQQSIIQNQNIIENNIKNKKDLNKLKINDLKNICNDNNIFIKGKKKNEIIDIVWTTIYSNKTDSEEKEIDKDNIESICDYQNISNISTIKNINSDDIKINNEYDSDAEETEIDTDNMESIYIDENDNIINDNSHDKNLKIFKLFKKKWIFDVNDNSITFIGMINSNKIKYLDEPPEELLQSIN